MSIDNASHEGPRDVPGSHVPRIVRMRERLGGAANDATACNGSLDLFQDDALPAYAELHCLSDFSFLRGVASAEDLFERARHCGYRALAITDECSLSGIVRAHEAAKLTGVQLVVGAEFRLDDGMQLVLLVEDKRGYAQLCRLITTARIEADKGTYHLSRADVARDAFDDGATGLFALWLPGAEPDAGEGAWLRATFGDRAHLAVELHRERDDHARLAQLLVLADALQLTPLASGDVHMATRRQRVLQDTVTAIRHGLPLAEAGAHLFRNGERHLRTRRALGNIHASVQGGHALLQAAAELAARCTFSMDELAYVYPRELVPEGETPASHLRKLTQAGMRWRWPEGVPAKVAEQIDSELTLIAELQYEAFFLTVEDIVRFANARGILCQGRGSSANSAVCYALGITAVNPTESRLLMARFLSKARKEPPDIDVDFEHERREEVMQYIYAKYGRSRAALAATVIRYRGKSAVRDVAKAFGLPPDQVTLLAGCYSWGNGETPIEQRVQEAGFDVDSALIQRVLVVTEALRGRPRHLSQHVGGFVISDAPLWQLVPVENAAMADRTIIQWEKDDLESLGLLKVDCLALGMLTCIRKALDLVRTHRGRDLTIATIPTEDRATYEMIQQADTVGVFQIESRAQMSMLPRLKPRTFYDLVVEVAIVRPGPIQGGMVHPYLRRRMGKETPTYPSAGIEEILKSTLGVPLFQEQVMELVIHAGYTPGEADQLRRSMAAWRHGGDMEPHRARIRTLMEAKGYDSGFIDQIFEQIKGFGSYGFPQSHAASFAKLVYASCWLKRHEPAAFACGLLNAQPMGFYSASQIVQDARRGKDARAAVEFLPVDVVHSAWDNTLVDAGLVDAGLVDVRWVDAQLKGASPTVAPPGGAKTRPSGTDALIPEVEKASQAALYSNRHPRAGGDPVTLDVSAADKPVFPQRTNALRQPLPSTSLAPPALDPDADAPDAQPAIRLGLRQVHGLSEHTANAIVAARRQRPFHDVADLCLRADLDAKARNALAEAGALRTLAGHRHDARWQVAGIERQRPLFPGSPQEEPVALPAPRTGADVLSDYRATGMTLQAHPLSLLRDRLRARRLLASNELQAQPHGRTVHVAGIVTQRQKPGTASGTIFVTLEDEHGMVNVIVWPRVAQRQRRALLGATLLAVRGRWECVDGVVHLIARDLEDLSGLLGGLATTSRDFH